MAPLKQKGDLAELAVALDLRRRGYRIAFPFGEDCDYDLVLDRGGPLERVQVKHCRSDGQVLEIRCVSHSLTNGKVRVTKHDTEAMIEWLAAYDATTQRCFYVPAALLGNGRNLLSLRLTTARNNQVRGTRMAEDFIDL